MASFNANCSDNASAGGDVTLATLYVTWYLKETAGIVVVVWSYEQFFAAFCQYNDIWLQPPKKNAFLPHNLATRGASWLYRELTSAPWPWVQPGTSSTQVTAQVSFLLTPNHCIALLLFKTDSRRSRWRETTCMAEGRSKVPFLGYPAVRGELFWCLQP